MLSEFLISLSLFYGMDVLLTYTGFEGVYYFVHAIHNCLIVQSAAKDVYYTLTDVHNALSYPSNTSAAAMCAALHIYHILRYRQKLQWDDYLHHGLMIFVALPIGVFYPSGTFLGYSLFFSTGLPSILDYFLLFAVRNGYADRMFEKKVNRVLQLWLRLPGCVSHGALVIASCLSADASPMLKGVLIIPGALMAWNGIYFMDLVVEDYARRTAVADAHEA